jgi:arginine exporter protein ArgO
VPNATTQFMVGPLLMRSAFFFSLAVGVDVLRNFFNAENVLRQQVEAEIKER